MFAVLDWSANHRRLDHNDLLYSGTQIHILFIQDTYKPYSRIYAQLSLRICILASCGGIV
jgi:hypothetical protein